MKAVKEEGGNHPGGDESPPGLCMAALLQRVAAEEAVEFLHVTTNVFRFGERFEPRQLGFDEP